MAEDPFFTRLYSSVSKCFGEGQPSSNVNNSVDLFNRYKAECLSLVNNKTTEQDQFCLKICILNKLEIIMPDTSLSNNETSTHMSVDPESSATQLLFFYLGELQHGDEISNSGEVTTCEMMAKRSDRIQARLKKCEKISK
ncbi:unnamed protein product [Orchesella dallaii]|uniref:Uncharacterized protein n=1 Tax=Orchesella dallaii TaxID=48710 RepID=A0ABP1RK59_9HEXA